MLKVLTVLGTRPEIIKLSCVIPELDRCVKHVLVHTGQNYDYELNQIFFDGLGLRKPDHCCGSARGVVSRRCCGWLYDYARLFSRVSRRVYRAGRPRAPETRAFQSRI